MSLKRGRPFKANDVPLAPFSLVSAEPMKSNDVYSKLGFRRYVAARGKVAEDRATQDPTPCPMCGCTCEWALTFKRDPSHDKGGENYIYARCKDHPNFHRWGFRDAPMSRPTPPPALVAETPNPKPVTPKEEEMAPVKTPIDTVVAPAGALDALVDARINAIVGRSISDLKATLSEHETALADGLSEAQIRKILDEALKGVAPKVIEVHTPVAVLKVNGIHHPILDELLERYALGERTFLLVGPAGTGKTTIAEQFMRAINATRYSVIPCSEDKRAAEFIGWKNAVTGDYQATALVEDLLASWHGEASGTIIEEMDASGANVLLTLNTLTNGYLCTPDAAIPMCPRGPEHVMIATANTYGNAGSLTYVGRNQLDGATTNRYRKLFVGYDQGLEIAITGDAAIVEHGNKIRAKMEALKMRRIWGTRDLMRMKFDTRLSANKGKNLDQIFKALAQNEGWSADEISRVVS